jgi:toxin ParE1/3/4
MTPPRFSPQSQRDLNDIGDYIAKDSPQNAARFVARLEQHCELIAQQPLIGRIRDEVRPGLRSFGFGRYVIFYRPIAESVEIVRVIHSARDIKLAMSETGQPDK